MKAWLYLEKNKVIKSDGVNLLDLQLLPGSWLSSMSSKGRFFELDLESSARQALKEMEQNE